MKGSYLPGVQNVRNNQMMLNDKNEYQELMYKQNKKKRLKLRRFVLKDYPLKRGIFLNKNKIFHSFKLLKVYLNLLRIRKLVLLQI